MNKFYLFLVFMVGILVSSCEDDYYEQTSIDKIPEWVKNRVSAEELESLFFLSEKYDINFFELSNNEHYTTLKEFLNGQITKADTDENFMYVRVKTRGESGSGTGGGSEGGSEGEETNSLGNCNKEFYSGKIGVFKLTKATVYFGYSYANNELKEITSMDIDVVANIASPVPYWVGRGPSYEISDDKKMINYLITGDIRYKVEGSGGIGLELTLKTFDGLSGSVSPNI